MSLCACVSVVTSPVNVCRGTSETERYATGVISTSTSRGHVTRPRDVTPSTAFTVSLNDDDDRGLQLHDDVGRFLPAALQQRSRTVSRRGRDAPSAAVAMETNNNNNNNNNSHVTVVTCERRRDSAHAMKTAATTTTADDATTKDEEDDDVTKVRGDVTSDAGRYSVDVEDIQRTTTTTATSGSDDPSSRVISGTGGLVVSSLDQRPRGRGFECVGCGLSCSNRELVALCTLGLGLLNPSSSRGR